MMLTWVQQKEHGVVDSGGWWAGSWSGSVGVVAGVGITVALIDRDAATQGRRLLERSLTHGRGLDLGRPVGDRAARPGAGDLLLPGARLVIVRRRRVRHADGAPEL